MQMMARQQVDISRLTSLQAGLASIVSGMVVPVTPSQSWKDLLLAVREVAPRSSAASLATELQSRHPGTSSEEVQAALLQEVADQAVATSAEAGPEPLAAADAEQIALATAEAVTAVDQHVLEQAAASEEWLFGLLKWVVSEIEERLPGFELTSNSLQVILVIFAWLVPSPYTVYHDIVEDRDAAKRHEELVAAIGESGRKTDDVVAAIKQEHVSHTLRYRVARRAAIRDGPAGSAKMVERLMPGAIVIQRERQGRWLHVQADRPEGTGQFTGWLYAANVELLPTGERP
jgi:ribose 1,5-bisphosphokinase PhnN